MNKRNTLSTIICTLLAVMMIAVFIPVVPGEAYAADTQIKMNASELEEAENAIREYSEKFRELTQDIINIENDHGDGLIDDSTFKSKKDAKLAELDTLYTQIDAKFDELTAVGLDLSESKTKLEKWYQDYRDEELSLDDYWINSYNELSEDVGYIDSFYTEALENEQAEEVTEPEPKYVPGKDIKTSKAQDKLRVDAGWGSYRAYGQDGVKILSIKKDKSLWDLSKKKKITTKVKDMVSIEDSDTNGIFVIKTNGNLYYYYQKSSGKWGSYKLLSGVKEFANTGFIDFYHKPFIFEDGAEMNLCVVKKNGNFMKGRIEFNKGGTKVTKNKWKKLMSGVSHGYVVCGSDEKYNETINYFALKANGSLYAWGSNRYGEAGNGKNKKVSKPRLVMKNVDKFYWIFQYIERLPGTGGTTCYAIKKNGDLYAWGYGSGINTLDGSYPDDYKYERVSPLKLLSNVSMVDGDAYDLNFIALTRDGVLWAWGNKAGSKSNYSTDEGGWGVGWDSYDEVGMTKIAKDVIAADTNGTTILYIKKDNSLWYRGWPPVKKLKESLDKSKKVTTNVSAIKSTKLWGIFILKTNGTLYGTGYTYKKYHSKLTKLGTGFYK